jgi:hypothetical protein
VPGALPDRSATRVIPEDARAGLAKYRPKLRPDAIKARAAASETAANARARLSEYRPVARPAVLRSPEEAAAESPDAPATARAVAQSIRPTVRPGNFRRVVARANPELKPAPRLASIPPRTVTPKIPSSTSVTREATIQNAINLRRINLIGVYGKPSERRALVRLSNGRYKKVKVGDTLDGGRVSAIGDSELRYQRRGRNLVLKMPRS